MNQPCLDLAETGECLFYFYICFILVAAIKWLVSWNVVIVNSWKDVIIRCYHCVEECRCAIKKYLSLYYFHTVYAIYAVNNVNVHVKFVKYTFFSNRHVYLPQYCCSVRIVFSATEVCTVAHHRLSRKSNGGLCSSRASCLATPLVGAKLCRTPALQDLSLWVFLWVRTFVT